MTHDERTLLLDLWAYATGEPWADMDEEDAQATGETLGELYERMRDVLKAASVSPSYCPCEHCGADCLLLGTNPDEPCWGKVTVECETSESDKLHTCEGHSVGVQPYRPEEKGEPS